MPFICMCITYQYDLADLGFYDLGLNLYLKNSRPPSMEDAMVPTSSHKTPDTQLGGINKNPGFKGMAAWRRASWRLTHVVPRDKN